MPPAPDTPAARDLPSFSSRLQRRAISTVFSIASGTSSNSSAISCGDLQVLLARCSGARRFGSPSSAPSWMQTRASCASKSSRAEEAHVVGRDDRHAAARPPDRARRCDVALLALAPGALQLEVVTIAEQREPAARARCAHRRRGRRRARGRHRRRARRTARSGRAGFARRASCDRSSRRRLLLAFEIRAAHQPREIPIADVVLTQQHQRRGLDALAVLRARAGRRR